MKVQRQVKPEIFKSSSLKAYTQDGRYLVIEQAGACDLPVSYSEKEFNSIFQIIEE